VLDKSFKDDFT